MQSQQESERIKSYHQHFQELQSQLAIKIPTLPTQKKEIIMYIDKQCVNESQMKMSKEKVVSSLIDLNRMAIENKFIQMMEGVFQAIQLELNNYRKYGSIQYLDPIIVSKLDRQIYHKGYKLHKKKQTPMYQLLQSREIDISNKLFTELFDIMNQLLTTMKIYYGYEDNQNISVVLYQAIGEFIEKHEGSVILKEDRLSMAIEEERYQKKSQQRNIQGYEVVVDVLQAMSKPTTSNGGMIDKAGKYVGVFYKYGISPAVDAVYETIKNINPLAKTSKISKQEQQKLKIELITHLLPHLSVRQPLEQQLVTYLIKLVPMTPAQILKTMGDKQRQKFIDLLGTVLSNFENPSGQFMEVVKQLMSLFNLVMSIDHNQGDQFYNDFQEGKWLILLYKTLQQKYNTERRRFLLNICRYPEISQKLENPVGILKLVESQSLPQTALLKSLRSLSVSKNKTLQNENKQQKFSKQRDMEITLAVEHQLHRIHLYELKKRYDKPPFIQFQRLTNCSPKRTVTLLFSGFMSQDTCKVDEWQALLESVYDSEMYSVRWQSKSYGDLFDYAIQTGKDIAKANLSIGILGQIGGPYLRAIAIIRQLYKKYNSNPFNPAFQSAKITGDFLAEIIIANFKGHFINLVGYSLGAQLIMNIIRRLHKRGNLHMINKIYFMGGVADRKELQELLQNADHPLNILNMHSNNDSALKYFLKLCKPSIEPIGLHPIRQDLPSHIIQNQDCSDLIDGHLAYRTNLKVLDKLMNIKDD